MKSNQEKCITVKTLIKATLFNNYISKSRILLEVEKIFCPLGVTLLEGRILIGGISVTFNMCIRLALRLGSISWFKRRVVSSRPSNRQGLSEG